MKLFIKESAVIDEHHFRPHMARIWGAAILTAPPMEDDTLVCTSGIDPAVGRVTTSKHPAGDALDFRCRSIVAPDIEERHHLSRLWASRMGVELGPDYDVIFEPIDTDPSRDHLHAEYDPHRGATMPIDQEVQEAIARAVAKALAGKDAPTKPASASKTIAGGLAAFIGGLAALIIMAKGGNPEMAATAAEPITQGIEQLGPPLVAIIGGLTAIYGRLVAVTRIR